MWIILNLPETLSHQRTAVNQEEGLSGKGYLELPIQALQKRPGFTGLRVLFCAIWLIKNLPIGRVSWLLVFWALNRLLWDAPEPSLEHMYRAVPVGQRGPATAASKRYAILTA